MKMLRFKNNEVAQRMSLPSTHRSHKGQSMVEVALVLPLLVLILGIVIEAGLALNAWTRVNTAARDSTRFVLNAGRTDDANTLVVNKLRGIDFGSDRGAASTKLDVYVITGTTTVLGTLPSTSPNWNVHHYGSGPATPNITASVVQQRLSTQGADASKCVVFVLVEVDYIYTPIVGTIVNNGALLPMSSYALAQSEQQTPSGGVCT
ncbi:MAG: pilus assembly protein [Chloroflexi bacterium]|nr:pilus assembly protein [Chloroflexota bacterium]